MHFTALLKRMRETYAIFTKTLLIMKLTAFLLMAFLQVNAAGYGQRFTLSLKEVPIEEAFKEIRKQCNSNFIYGESQVQLARKVTINLVDATLKEVLQACFKDQPLTYVISGNDIIVRRKQDTKEAAPANWEMSGLWAVITGYVTDSDGKMLRDVSVKNLRTQELTATDKDGRFSLPALIGDKLEFTFVGYQPQWRQVISEREPLSVSLSIAVEQMNDMVIVGYGSVKRKDLTGSVASVSMNELKNVPSVTFDNAIAGKAPGVQVVKADGSPGGAVRIRIRGGSSLIGSNDPLYIIDGVPVMIENKYVGITDMTNPVENFNAELEQRNTSVQNSFFRGLNSLAGLNIDDIESIDILKDASATAIYGAKAANGVVIISTKRGKLNQKPILELNYYSGLSKPLKEKVLGKNDYRLIIHEAAKNRVAADLKANRAPDAAAKALADDIGILGDADSDWLDLILRNGKTQNGNISVRGGGKGSRYYTSLAFTNQQGTIINTGFSRIAGKVNLDNEISERLRVISNLDYSFTKSDITNGAYAQALMAPPVFAPYQPDGSFTMFDSLLLGTDRGLQNPLALTRAINRAKTYSLIGSLSLEYDVLKDLKYRSTASANFSSYRQLNYIPSFVEIGLPSALMGTSSDGGIATQASNESINVFFENTLTWDKQFNSASRLNLLAGTSWEKYQSEFFSGEGRGFPDDELLNNLNSAAQATQVKGSNPLNRNALLSYYTRANYAWKERYLFTFTGRADISSKFGKGKQAGYFPSGAVAWRISKESFLRSENWIDEIKIRLSAGYTGSQSIADNMFRTLFTPTSYAGYSAVVPSQLGNDEIKWERTFQKDAGLDFTLFNSRWQGTIAYYHKKTDGLLLNITPPPSYAFGSVVMNIANVTNKGLEFDLRGDIIRSNSFTWNTALNISGNRSVVTKVNGGPFSDPNDRNNPNIGSSVVIEGQPLGLLYGWVALGIFNSEKDLNEYKSKVVYAALRNRFLDLGEVKYDTINGTTSLTKMDVIGHTTPDFFGGFTNTFTYRQFSIIAHTTFSYGNEILYSNSIRDKGVSTLSNHGPEILNRWTPENPSTTRERLIWGTGASRDQRSVYDASYVKLRSATLAYELPPSLVKRFGFRMASFYLSATNLLTLTSYPGLDPEVSDDPYSIIGGGRDISSYPSTREFTIGVRIGM